ncbi:hypothetical protein CWI39_1875p0010, partial [Hamiltosporidium magnivora]
MLGRSFVSAYVFLLFFFRMKKSLQQHKTFGIMPNIESDETFSMQAVGNNPCLDSDQRTISECSHFQPAYYRSKNTENFLSFSQRTSNKERDKMSRDSINLSKMGNNAKEQ